MAAIAEILIAEGRARNLFAPAPVVEEPVGPDEVVIPAE